MRVIDPDTWARREHFTKFADWDNPYFDMTVPVEVTALLPLIAERGISITAATVYVQARAANGIPEFRTRVRPGGVIVEHEKVHPSFTVMVDDGLFSFCYLDWDPEFSAFTAHVSEQIARVQAEPTLAERGTRDDLLFMTAIPWVSFTSFSHPIPTNAEYVPRFAWGKYYPDGDRMVMPLQVQGHHALMDGLHVGRYFEAVQGLLDDPEVLLNG
jgi:chloramphenicol O-acetyltransferase type A